MTLKGDLRQSDPVIGLEHHDPKGFSNERREPIYTRRKRRTQFFGVYPLKNVLPKWLFRKSEVTYVLNIVSNNKSTHTVKRWT